MSSVLSTEASEDCQDGPHRVLLIEDDRDVRAIAEIALRDLGGMAVTTCDTGAEGLRAIQAGGVDLVVLDLSLPDMTGAAVADAAWSGTNDPPPMVFLTGSPEQAQQIEQRHSGVIGVLGKPFDAMTLAPQVRRLWQDWWRSRAGQPSG